MRNRQSRPQVAANRQVRIADELRQKQLYGLAERLADQSAALRNVKTHGDEGSWRA